MPDETGRLEVLRIHTKNMKLDDAVCYLDVTWSVTWFTPIVLLSLAFTTSALL